MSTYLAAHAFLQECGASFCFDEFSEKAYIEAPFLPRRRQLDDRSNNELRHKMAADTGIDPGRDNIYQAALNLAFRNSYNPVRDYFEALEHDGKDYAGDLLLKWLGAELTPLNRNTIRRFAVGIVTRVFRPGSRVNLMPIFSGSQRAGKTTLLRILARQPEYFTDADIFSLDAQRRQEAVRGKLIAEIPELLGWRTSRLERAKAIISADHDYGRRPYDLCSTDQPRTFVCAGTTNERNPFRDTTGNFRFPLLPVGEKIQLNKIDDKIDQIWGHAVFLYRQGYSLELSDKRAADLVAVQSAQFEDDSWVEALRTLAPTEAFKDELRVTYATIFAHLGIPLAQQTPQNARRASDAMVRNGWAVPVIRKIRGQAKRCFIKKEAGE
jgi:putative DNA primase/helicase